LDAQKLDCLNSLGIDVWVPRGAESPESEPVRLSFLLDSRQPGSDILCVVDAREQARSTLAANIGRAMRIAPCWSWLAREAGDDGLSPEEAVTELMITRLLIFGDDLTTEIFEAGPPECLGAARVHVVPSMDALSADQEAKRILWTLMREQGIAARQDQGK